MGQPISMRSLAMLLLVALAMRLGWGWVQPLELDARLGDQTEYLGFARNLLKTGQYKYYDPRFETEVYAWRSPGYPLFLAALRTNPRAVRVAQAIIDTSTVLAMYLLARKWLGHRGGLVAGGLVAFNPFLIYFTGLVLSETLYFAMVAWGMALLVASKRGWVVAGVIVLGASVLVRPSGIGLAILLPAVAGLRLGARTGLAYIAAAVVAVGLAVGPWAMRNRLHPQLKSWIWSTTNGGITSYDGFNPIASGASDQKDFVAKLKPAVKGMSELERDRWFKQQARQWIGDNPTEAIKLGFVKIARTWSPIPLSREYGASALYVAAGLLYALPLDLLVLVGLLWAGQRRGVSVRETEAGLVNEPGPMFGLSKAAKVFLVMPAIYLTVIHALSVGSLRYRLPAEPPMAVIAAGGVVALFSRIFNGPSQRNA